MDDAEKKGLDMTEKKAKGGRVGLRFGTKKKSNIEKIKKRLVQNKNHNQE